MIKKMSKIIGLLLLLFTLSTMVYADNVLNVPECTQEYDQWCWAGSSYTVLNYYGVNVSQCTIANFTRTRATWHDFGNVDCCKSSSTPGWKCNYWNYNWGKSGSIEHILKNYMISSYGKSSYLSKNAVRDEVDAGRPFIIRWGHKSGGGHFVVGHGLKGNDLYYMDPWYGEGKRIASYNWVVGNSKDDWTHTNVITTNPGPGPNPEPNPPEPIPDPIPADSCKGRCNNKAPSGCWCDSSCANYGDCCPDKNTECGY